MSNSSVFKIRFKVLRSSADLLLYDSKFQTKGALSPIMLTALRGTANNNKSRAVAGKPREAVQISICKVSEELHVKAVLS